ncbi:MAG: rane-anchored glycosyltransferase [Rhodocyclaceae bacterium]|nr:rane-anchored glycosyltransferase [Rhodocyclaceae bacterium]
MTRPQLSVVVPTYLRPDLLEKCLEALLVQRLEPAAYEILVVDDARSDTTRFYVADFARRHPGSPRLRYLRPPDGRRGPAAARNAGWRAATGDIVAFTDDDTLPAVDWLGEGLRAMAPEIMAAWGHVTVPLPDAPTDAQRNVAGLDGAEFITANCFIRREALEAVGGFDERFTRPWREDSDLYFTFLERGFKVVSVPEAVVIHPAHTAPPGTCLKQHRNLFYDALLYKKHPALYRQKIAASPPVRYYGIVAALVVGLLALIGGFPAVAVGALVVWLGLTGYVVWRRMKGTSRAFLNVADIVVTSAVIPVLAVYWRLAGALHFRVVFV